MFRSQSSLERQLAILRRLLRHLEAFAEHIAGVSPGSLHHAEVEDAIADGEYLLKQMGGVSARTAPVAPMVGHGPCTQH